MFKVSIHSVDPKSLLSQSAIAHRASDMLLVSLIYVPQVHNQARVVVIMLAQSGCDQRTNPKCRKTYTAYVSCNDLQILLLYDLMFQCSKLECRVNPLSDHGPNIQISNEV